MKNKITKLNSPCGTRNTVEQAISRAKDKRIKWEAVVIENDNKERLWEENKELCYF